MSKSFRALALVAALSLAAAPSLHAERFGTNPHPPTVTSAAMPTTLQTLAYTVLIVAGV